MAHLPRVVVVVVVTVVVVVAVVLSSEPRVDLDGRGPQLEDLLGDGRDVPPRGRGRLGDEVCVVGVPGEGGEGIIVN